MSATARCGTDRIIATSYAAILLMFAALELFTGAIKPPQIAEGWFSDIAYNINAQFTGAMAADIPCGALWSSGIGKIFFLAHHLFYMLLGPGIFQARLVSFAAGYLLLFLVYRWVSKHVSPKAAFFSIVLLSASPSWWTFLADARQDVSHCLFAFMSFYLISAGLASGGKVYYLAGGFLSALSVDIDYRGIEIVIASFIFYLAAPGKKIYGRDIPCYLAGSFAAFLVWFSLNIIPIGWENFIRFNITPSLGDGGPYTLLSLLSEPGRFFGYMNHAAGLGRIEVLYLIPLIWIFWRTRKVHAEAADFLFVWLAVMFAVMSVMERTTYPAHFLMYSPLLCIFAGAGFEKLYSDKRMLAVTLYFLVVVFGLTGHAARAGRYAYHIYVKKDYRPLEFAERLRSSVDPRRPMIGDVTNWYIFPDSVYYGGTLYLNRVRDYLHEYSLPGDYGDAHSRSAAILNVLRKRGIEYIIANRNLRFHIGEYFSGRRLPEKNFKLVSTIEDYYLGADSDAHPVRTEVYKVISYEP